MDTYIQNTLQINERVLIAPKLHWAVYFDIYFQLSLLYILACQGLDVFIAYDIDYRNFFERSQMYIGLAVLVRIVYLIIHYYSIEMAVTNYRVVCKIGVFNIKTEELANDRIESVSVRQTILGRILNYGDIFFSGTGTSKLVFKKVYAPWWIKSKSEDFIRQSYTINSRQPIYHQL